MGYKHVDTRRSSKPCKMRVHDLIYARSYAGKRKKDLSDFVRIQFPFSKSPENDSVPRTDTAKEGGGRRTEMLVSLAQHRPCL